MCYGTFHSNMEWSLGPEVCHIRLEKYNGPNVVSVAFE